MKLAACAAALVATLTATPVSADNFQSSGLVGERDVRDFLSAELDLVNGKGEKSSEAREHLERIRRDISTMYTSLPKNAEGKLNHQVVRYALHRFFTRRHGWFIRGLEPNNDTWHGETDPLNPDSHNSSAMKEWVPSFLQDALEQRLGKDGTDLSQLAALASALEDLIQKETRDRVTTAYGMYEFPTHKLLSQAEVDPMILTYFVMVLNSGDFSATNPIEAVTNTQEFVREYTGWNTSKAWLDELKAKHLVAKNERYDFESINRFANKIQEEYYTLNEFECKDLKVTLRNVQGMKPGRVRLSTFYNKGMYSHWDFSEKKEYLRSIGVLDESDTEHPSVIIANYAMARPNCLDSSNLFTICCLNECEEMMGKLESLVGESMASPAQIVKLVALMPSATVEADRKLSQSLVDRLDSIAAQHNGQVPLHGRLFAQWMHHVYPLECPFPHEVSGLTQGEWMQETGSESHKASPEELKDIIASDACAVNWDDPSKPVKCADETTAELPWSDNEELLVRPRALEEESPAVEEAPRRGVVAPLTALLACILAAGGLYLAVTKRSSEVAWKPIGSLTVAGLVLYACGLVDGTLLFLVFAVGLTVAATNRMTTPTNSKAHLSKADMWEAKECV